MHFSFAYSKLQFINQAPSRTQFVCGKSQHSTHPHYLKGLEFQRVGVLPPWGEPAYRTGRLEVGCYFIFQFIHHEIHDRNNYKCQEGCK